MTKMRVAVVDDEPLARDLIRNLLREDPAVDIVAECRDGSAAITAIRELKPDVVFLDVQMPDIDGFEVLSAFEPEELPYVIFVTAYDHYALDAFKVHALDYLLKPLEKPRFYECLARARKTIRENGLVEIAGRLAGAAAGHTRDTDPSGEVTFTVRQGSRVIGVPRSEIAWIEAANQYVRLHCRDSEHLLSRSLSDVHEALGSEDFVRIHRSAIVNVAFVDGVFSDASGGYTVALKTGRKLKLSRRRRHELTRLLAARDR